MVRNAYEIPKKSKILNVERLTKSRKLLNLVFTHKNYFLAFYPGRIDHAGFDSELKNIDL